MFYISEKILNNRDHDDKINPVTKFKRIIIIISMTLSAATFLHVNNYTPKQTFLSCDRPCHHLDWPMICRVKLILEPFHSLSKACSDCPINETSCLENHCISVDGHRRGILTVNRQLPGPSIQVCQNDILVVDVINRLPGKAAAIHWRGQNQLETPWMDGVPLVTQCPIPSYTTFQYKFRASVPGTHLWHSHSASDVSNGIFGSLIVRQADLQEPHKNLYDIDDPNNVLLISQWHHSMLTDLPKKPALLLINGKGRQDDGPLVPLTEFNVNFNKKYRFRIANAGGAGSCPVTVTIEKHSMLIIALDGNSVHPKIIKSLTLAKGERADIVLTTDNEISIYKINVDEEKGCSSTPISGTALLKYQGHNQDTLSSLKKPNQQQKINGIIYNELTTNPVDKCGTANAICGSELKSIKKIPFNLQKLNVDEKIYLPINQVMQSSEILGEFEMKMNINNGSFTYPSSPLLTQGVDIPYDIICSEFDPKTTYKCRNNKPEQSCECVNIKKISLGSTVELILIDQAGRDDLVFHLHGYNFYVVGARYLGDKKSLEEIKDMDDNNRLFLRNLDSPILKDTVVVPKYSAVAIRFKADNPGYWMLRDEHAFEWTRGLDVILQVGDVGDMVPPPNEFPKCGSFVGPDYFLI